MTIQEDVCIKIDKRGAKPWEEDVAGRSPRQEAAARSGSRGKNQLDMSCQPRDLNLPSYARWVLAVRQLPPSRRFEVARITNVALRVVLAGKKSPTSMPEAAAGLSSGHEAAERTSHGTKPPEAHPRKNWAFLAQLEERDIYTSFSCRKKW